MSHRGLAIALATVVGLGGATALPALAQDDAAASPSAQPSSELLAPDASFEPVATVGGSDLAATSMTALLDDAGEPDTDAALASLVGWSALLLPGLVELAGDDPELLALVEALGSGDELEAGLQADLAKAVEAATDRDADKGGKGRKGRKRKEGATGTVFLAATLASHAWPPAAATGPAAEAPGGSGGLDGRSLADVAVLVDLFKRMIGPEFFRDLPAFKDSQTKDGVTATQSMEFGNDEFAVALEAGKDGQTVGGSLRIRLKGDACPDPDGIVKLEFKVQRDGAATATAGSTSFGDGFEGTATGHVDDSAMLTGYEYDGHATTRTAEPGSQAWVEATEKASYDTAFDASGTVGTWTLREGSGINPSRWSSQAQLKDSQRAVQNGKQINSFVVRVLANWQALWRSGWCVEVKADIPATLSPSEQRSFDVHVVHKDGSELDAPVEATLSGTRSLEPLRIDKAPGKLTYAAGDKKGETATIDLVSTSRRGIGKLKGTVKVEQPGYRMVGGADALKVDAVVCDFSKPFTVKGSGITLRFTPNSSDPLSGGTYEYSGDFKKFKVSGNGTYKLKLDAKGGTLDAKGPGKAIGPLGTFTNRGKEHYELTPADCS